MKRYLDLKILENLSKDKFFFLSRYADSEEPRLPIRDWMRSKEVISYPRLWESINNENFKGGEFDAFKNEAGRYDSGTFAHLDIAFELLTLLTF